MRSDDADRPVILVIDDSPMIRKLLEVRLSAEGYRFCCAEDGRRGLELARAISPALILLDLSMPELDGFEVLRFLKAEDETVGVPVIVISGSDDTDDKVTALDLGAVDYVTKPFNVPELRARVRSAMRITELTRMLSQKAKLDGLTGLWNRQRFDELLEAEVRSHERSGRPLSLCMCDLDLFKSLNDTHGHAAGDDVLRRVGDLMQRMMRATDVACRYGGEEFGLILRDTTQEQARKLLERIRLEIQNVVWPRHPERCVTGSFGVCGEAPGGSYDPLAWLERADSALYDAKASGRNRVHVAGVDPSPISEAA